MVLDRWTAGLAVCLYLFFLLFLAHESRFRIFRLRSFKGEKVFVLRFIQARNPEWVQIPFFAQYDETATWLDDLKPAFGEPQFFWQQEYDRLVNQPTAAQ